MEPLWNTWVQKGSLAQYNTVDAGNKSVVDNGDFGTANCC
jgi:hypothetical protein